MRDDTIIVRRGNRELSTRVVGNGPLAILLHGFPELGTSWRHQIAPLAEAGFTLAIPDQIGYGHSSKPDDVTAYTVDAIADDVAAIADTLCEERWVSIGHDWGAIIAWRTALRFPDRVAAVFGLSVPYSPPGPMPWIDIINAVVPDQFNYIRYFQEPGVAEAELERDVRNALKHIFYAASGEEPTGALLAPRPIDSQLLQGLATPATTPLSFLPDAQLDHVADAFAKGGFAGPLSWYRNTRRDFDDAQSYGDHHIRQPSGFLYGDKEVTVLMNPPSLDVQREFLDDLRSEIVLKGAGHWIQQERPEEVSAALVDFLSSVKALI